MRWWQQPELIWPEDLNFWDVADFVAQHEHLLSENERGLVFNMQHWPKEPTDKQLAWLISIYHKIRDDGTILEREWRSRNRPEEQ
jgi:hypothetical protein